MPTMNRLLLSLTTIAREMFFRTIDGLQPVDVVTSELFRMIGDGS
jgi:hypothetical protein